MAAPVRPSPPDSASGAAPMTLEQFLAWEERQELRHEFVDGYPHAMTGATVRHNIITGNVFDLLRAPARASGCRADVHNMQVRTPAGRVYYPDVVVLCGPFAFDDRHARTPCVVVEVTSPSTRRSDHGRKLEDYRTIPSLQAYVIVEQAMRRMECHVRLADGAWSHHEVSGATGLAEFTVPCVDAVLSLADVYADTDVAPPPPDLIAASEHEPADELPPP